MHGANLLLMSYPYRIAYFTDYGGRRRGTHLFRDQLDRAGAGSWQIADGGVLRAEASTAYGVDAGRR